MRKLALILAILSAPAMAQVMAVLQSQTQVQTAGGGIAWQCVYQVVGGPRFVQIAQLSQGCASTAAVN